MDYTQRAIESIVENEALTADLDDQAASVLLDWAMSLARQTAQGVASMEEASADEQFETRMRNVRQFIRQVNRWAGNPASTLSKVLELAAPIYGEGLARADASRIQSFSDETEQLSQAEDRISGLRRLLENRG